MEEMTHKGRPAPKETAFSTAGAERCTAIQRVFELSGPKLTHHEEQHRSFQHASQNNSHFLTLFKPIVEEVEKNKQYLDFFH